MLTVHVTEHGRKAETLVLATKFQAGAVRTGTDGRISQRVKWQSMQDFYSPKRGRDWRGGVAVAAG